MNRFLAMIAGISAVAFVFMVGPAEPNQLTYSAMESIGHFFVISAILISMGGFIAAARVPEGLKPFCEYTVVFGLILGAFGLSILPIEGMGKFAEIPSAILLSTGVAMIATSMRKPTDKSLRSWSIGVAMFTGSMAVHSLADGWSLFGSFVFLVGGLIMAYLLTKLQPVESVAPAPTNLAEAGARTSTIA